EQAWDVGLACGGTIDVLVQPLIPEPVLAAARGSDGPRGRSVAVATQLPADAPPSEFGPHEPGNGSPPGPSGVIGGGGEIVEGGTGDTGLDTALGAAAARVLDDGRSRTVDVGDR